MRGQVRTIGMFQLSEESRGARVRELKYVAPAEALAAAEAALDLHCLPDPEHPEGIVESIYFDDDFFSSYWEKVNGDSYKRKVRLRWYAEGIPPTGCGEIPAFLDVKDRMGALREKRHVAFRANKELLCRARLRDPALRDLLRGAAMAAGLPFTDALVPTIGIRYRRRRYVCPWTGARINLDSDICSLRANTDLFSGEAPLGSERIVCEAKAPAAREWPWGETLMRLGFRMQSFSKYGLFMEMRMEGSI